MPSLTDKLKDLGVQIGASKIKSGNKRSTPVTLPEALMGAWESTRSGECFVVRKHLPFSSIHGNRPLSQLPQIGIVGKACLGHC